MPLCARMQMPCTSDQLLQRNSRLALWQAHLVHSVVNRTEKLVFPELDRGRSNWSPALNLSEGSYPSCDQQQLARLNTPRRAVCGPNLAPRRAASDKGQATGETG